MPTEQWFREHDDWRGRQTAYRRAFRDHVCYEPQSVLDVGCALGDGLIAARKVWPNARVNGLDISRVALRKCYLRLPDGVFLRWDMATEPMPKLTPRRLRSDLVLCFHTLEHIGGWALIQGAIEQMLRVVKRQLIVLVPNERHIPSKDHTYLFNVRSFDSLHPSAVELVGRQRVVAIWEETNL